MEKGVDHRRVYWHSRRGMLELDLILVPFAEQCYGLLCAEDKAAYTELLSCEDTDIYTWLMQRKQPEGERLKAIVQRIVQHANNKTGST